MVTNQILDQSANPLSMQHPLWVSSDGASALYHNDAFDLLPQLPDESVDCIWTDPPYKLSNDGITCSAGKMVSVNKGQWDESEGIDADHEFNLEWISQCKRVLKPAGTIWISGTLHIYPSIGMALLQNGYRLLNDIIWEKPNPPPNLGCRTFTHSTEVILWATKAKKGSRHKYTFNYHDMKRENGDKQMKTVWSFPAPGKSEKLFGKHPTQKPVALIERCLRASTNVEDVVLDPFAGSGSTGVAAIRTNRRFLGIESNSEYADIAKQRLEQTVYLPPPPRVFRGWYVLAWRDTRARWFRINGNVIGFQGLLSNVAEKYRHWCGYGAYGAACFGDGRLSGGAECRYRIASRCRSTQDRHSGKGQGFSVASHFYEVATGSWHC